jgi:ABC-type Fe3+ transport system substrate-binding protein
VFWSTDISHYPVLKACDALAQYNPQNVGALAGRGEVGCDIPATVSWQIMVYHTKNVKPEDVPTNSTDLLDPRWKGRVRSRIRPSTAISANGS